MGIAINIEEYAQRAHACGAYLSVDATFAPPPLQDPFLWGADIVLHSGTKYFGGHSDMLCGVLAINHLRADTGWVEQLHLDREHLGSVMGNMEGWLGVRSLRTLELRVKQQSQSAGRLVEWFDAALHGGQDSEAVIAVVESVHHASLQKEDLGEAGWLAKQMPNGFGPVFGITMKTRELARCLPSRLQLFQHATSLGGVESLIEWRTMSDSTCANTLLRISVGLENWEDLKSDLLLAFLALQTTEAEYRS